MGNPETTTKEEIDLSIFDLIGTAQDPFLQEILADDHVVWVLFKGGGGVFRRRATIVKSERDLYPSTVIRARYSGTYENEGKGQDFRDGKFVAFPLHCYDVPRAALGDDDTCCGFFASVDMRYIGLGNTPQEAYDDLVDKLLVLSAANPEIDQARSSQ